MIYRLFAFTLALAAAALSGPARGQTFVLDVIDDTFILNNGGLTADTEDNFGARTEIIGNTNGGNFRHILLRFDVSAAMSEINNPGLVVVDATLTLNPRNERSDTQPSAGQLGVYGLVSGNQGWREGTRIGSGSGASGQFEAVSARFLSTPSSQSNGTIGGSALPDPKVDTDGLRWFSQGGGATVTPLPGSLFSLAADTSNVVLGVGDISTLDTVGDSDWDIPLNGSFLDSFVTDWLAAPLMTDDNGGMQTSNAGLVLAALPGSPAGQVFFESIEGRAEEAAKLTITFGPAGDPNDSGFANELDFEIIRQNFFQPFTERGEGDLVDNDFIDFADYAQWKQAPKFPDPGAGGFEQAPEPGSAVLGVACLVAITARRRRSKTVAA